MEKGSISFVLLSVIAVAIFVSSINVSEHFFVTKLQEENALGKYNPFPIKGGNSLSYDKALFMGLARELLDHQHGIFFGDAYLKEHKETKAVEGTMGYWPLAWALKLFNYRVAEALLFVSFIFTFIVFILFYLLCRKTLVSHTLSLCIPIITLLAPKNPLYLFLYDENYLPKYFNRFPKILFSFLFVLAFFYFLQRLLKNPTYKNALFLGLVVGVSYYDYAFYFSGFSVVLATLFVCSLVRPYIRPKFFFISGITAVLVSIPFWINYLQRMPYGDFLIESKYTFQNVTDSTLIAWFCVAFSLLLFNILRLQSNKDKDLILYLVIIPLSSIATLEMIAYLGNLVPQPYHFSSTLILPLIPFSFFILASSVLKTYDKQKYLVGFAAVMAVLCLSSNLSARYLWSKKNYEFYQENEEIFQVFRNIESIYPLTVQADKVLLSMNSEINHLSFIHTDLNQYFEGYHMGTANFEERWERFLIACRIYGVDKEQLLEMLPVENFYAKTEGDPESFEKYMIIAPSFHEWYSSRKVDKERVLSSYEEVLKRSHEDILTRFHLDLALDVTPMRISKEFRPYFSRITSPPSELSLYELSMKN